MKHAGAAALDLLQPLLTQVRLLACGVPHSVERKPGTFYWRGAALLHFHEDPAGLFADLKMDGQFIRFAVNSEKERRAFLQAIAKVLKPV